METAEELAARFDSRAGHYDESQMHRALAASAAAFALDGSAYAEDRPRRVLDVATGTGLVLRSMPDDANVSLTGIDISSGMLAVARTALPAAQFVMADAARLPFENASFDLITCATAIHLLPDASAALREWRRVLAPNGRVVLATFAVDAEAEQGDCHVGHGSTGIEVHARFGSKPALETFASTAGMRVARLQRWSSPAGAPKHDECLIAELLPA